MSFSRLFPLALAIALSVPLRLYAAAPEPLVCLAHNVPAPAALRQARLLGRVAPGTPIHLAISLPLRNQAQLTDLLRRLYDPADPLHGHFLSTAEFTERFGPTQEDYDAVAAWARSRGLTVTQTYPSRTLIDVAAGAAAVEAAFAVHLNRFQLAGGQKVYAHDAAPRLPRPIAARVAGVVGLTDIGLWRRPHFHRIAGGDRHRALLAPHQLYGPAGGFAPQGLNTAYNLQSTGLTGAGQTLGLYELDAYDRADINQYATQFGLTRPVLQDVLVDGFPGTIQDPNAQIEVTLDIDMMIALAPKAKILVYEGANGTAAQLDIYTKMASDNLAKSLSTSWGIAEEYVDQPTLQGENQAFQQMAAQGQSMFDASGDSGAYDDAAQRAANNQPYSLSVDDPASQPYMTGVGGTVVSVDGNGNWTGETTWTGTYADAPNNDGGSGGGISSVWPKPDYQLSPLAVGAGLATNMRDVPDVALNASGIGVDIYQADQGTGGANPWFTTGGTSASAPLWAAFAGLVNQQRQALGRSPLGFVNPILYQLAAGPGYSALFHDINDGSNNLYYTAGPGYDDTTGLGSFIGSALLGTLAPLGNWQAVGVSAGSDNRTRVLWANNSGAVSLWVVTDSTGSHTLYTFGPFPGWTAKAVSTGADNKTRILWTRTDGTVSLWIVNDSTGVPASYGYGPYAGWTAKAISTGTDNNTRILWNNTNGTLDVWTINDSTGAPTSYSYGPFPGWSAQAIAAGPDGSTRVLWSKTDGTLDLWDINGTTGAPTSYTYGPYAGWSANGISVGPDNQTRVLWSNTNGTLALWNVDNGSGNFSQAVYGPYAGWSALAIAAGPDNRTRVLWNETDNKLALWSADNSTGYFTQNVFGPF